MTYPVREFPTLRGLAGLSDKLIAAHLKLYAAYVANTNALLERVAAFSPASPEGAEVRRRYGWEINGVRLHEYYFEALAPDGGSPGPKARRLLTQTWGSVDAWRTEFSAMGRMRGVGWVITYFDRRTGQLTNNWIELHQDGHPAGFKPLIVMDCWEHAFTGMVRAKYVDCYLDNLNWEVVEGRYGAAKVDPSA